MNISQIQLNTLETLRLHIRKLEVSDAAFIHTLVNTPNWIRYIGDKGIHSVEAAADYIYSILSHQQNIIGWSVTKQIRYPSVSSLLCKGITWNIQILDLLFTVLYQARICL
ncbi:MAG: hypothetical protein IPI18_09910 [Saprospiraceae bacterium]|nr:hypothetical protein [Saprospiraceae bacterium]